MTTTTQDNGELTIGTPTLDTEEEGVPIIAIGHEDVERYFWWIATQLTMYDEIILRATDNNMSLLIRIVDTWTHFGIEEIKGSRKPVITKDKRDGRILRVTQVKIRKKGFLR